VTDPAFVRGETLQRLERAGFPSPPVHFPTLWEPGEVPRLRDAQQVRERAAVLNVIVNCAYGMPSPAAAGWLADNGLAAFLTEREQRVVAGAPGQVDNDRVQVEAINALAWVLGIVATLDVGAVCGDDLATKLPDLRRGEPVTTWIERTRMRPRAVNVAVGEWDFYFCWTWGLAEANLLRTPAPGPLPQYVYWQRRRAFEFVFSDHESGHRNWDDLDLST
jgi:Domain of unknown function (DUF4272)